MNADYSEIVVGNEVFYNDRNADVPSGRYTIIAIEGDGPVNDETIVKMVNDQGIVIAPPAVCVEPVYARLQLTLDVTFEMFGTPPRYLAENLKALIQFGVANGMLTGNTAAEIVENGYTVETKQLEVPQPRRPIETVRVPNPFIDQVAPLVANLVEKAKGETMLFESSLKQPSPENKIYQDHNGQRAELVRVIFDQESSGMDLFDQEVLPAFRVRFADGVEFEAFGEEFPELPSDDAGPMPTNPALSAVYRVCLAFGRARTMGFIGLDHIGVQGTPEQLQSVLDILKD